VIRVDHARWGQTPEDLRHLALNAPHTRTRERALALFDITQHSCATQVAGRTGRRAHTVMEWVHAYNQGDPDAVTFCRLADYPLQRNRQRSATIIKVSRATAYS
jgi:hypothetical protein